MIAAKHHSMIHAVFSGNPAASGTVRLARKWIASHLLSGLVPNEAVELVVAYVFSDPTGVRPIPGSVVAGFMGFLRLLGTHDWARRPLVVDPQNHISTDELIGISSVFDKARGKEYKNGPPMFIISPYDRSGAEDDSSAEWSVSCTSSLPEKMVLARAGALARRTFSFLQKAMMSFQSGSWASAFLETTSSFRSYSALMRVDRDLVADSHSSSTTDSLARTHSDSGTVESAYTRSMLDRYQGPKELRKTIYRNLSATDGKDSTSVLLHWNPAQELTASLRQKAGSRCIFFVNDLSPEVICCLWRPLFQPKAFSALTSEYAAPVVAEKWKSDTFVVPNMQDLLWDLEQSTEGIVVDTKVLDSGPERPRLSKRTLEQSSKGQGKKRAKAVSSSSESEDSDSDEE